MKTKNLDSVIRNASDGVGIRVQPRDSVASQEIANNAIENMTLIPKDAWLTKGKINDETAWLVSAGPSLSHLLANGFLRKEWFGPDTKNVLFCVKHALPTLTKFGFTPHFCTVLDPRPIKGVSTHGFLRESLYSKATKFTKFLVASMTHPTVTKYLTKNGYETIGWHSAANGLVTNQKDLDRGVPPGPLQNVKNFIQGGTCSATRSISLAHYMGFRRCNLVAFDSNLAGPPTDPEFIDTVDGQKVKKYWKINIGDSKDFWTTGELIAQIQDMQMFLTDDLADIEINIVGADKGSSLIGALNETIKNKTHLKHYTSQTKGWEYDV